MTMPAASGDDPYHLARFVDAQAPVYHQVQRELQAGRKESHWMWFIFPQLAGLGSSAISQHFAIQSIGEARAYSDHALLGARLRESTHRVLALQGRTPDMIFGFPDDRKFQSSMTLFGASAREGRLFLEAIRRYFDGKMDPATLQLLGKMAWRP